MATEKTINGRKCKCHNGIWVTADGKYVAVDTIWKTAFSEIPSTKPATVHTDKNGEKYVRRKIRGKFYNIYIRMLSMLVSVHRYQIKARSMWCTTKMVTRTT
ncbi:MAG: hypothetical protein IJB01_03780 [Bacteroidaceae bacterium]|nr:hypothetical protein [Bacteroidaceae bacterium]